VGHDLPIYSDAIFRSANPFPVLETIQEGEVARCLERFDRGLDFGEGAGSPASALQSIGGVGRVDIVALHQRMFTPRAGAGTLRTSTVAARFRGQDCPDPEFIAQSLDNLEKWLQVDSMAELHPIQQTAMVLTRLIDIWPFEFGNRTTATVFANGFLYRAGLPPFFIPAGQVEEFETILAHAITMQTEGLVRAIYKCIERELELVRS